MTTWTTEAKKKIRSYENPGTHPLERVWAASRLQEDARVMLVDAVDEARKRGCTWAEIGDQLGISRQGAFNRFGEPDESAQQGADLGQ